MQGQDKWLRFVREESEYFERREDNLRRHLGTALVSAAVLIWAFLELTSTASPTHDDWSNLALLFGLTGVMAYALVLLTFVMISKGFVQRGISSVKSGRLDFTPKHEREHTGGYVILLSLPMAVFAVAILISGKANFWTVLIAITVIGYVAGFLLLSYRKRFWKDKTGEDSIKKFKDADIRRAANLLFSLVLLVVFFVVIGLAGQIIESAQELLHLELVEMSLVLLGVSSLLVFITSQLIVLPSVVTMQMEVRKLEFFMLSGMSESEVEERLVELYGEFRWDVLKLEAAKKKQDHQ